MEKTSQNAHKIHGSCGWRFFSTLLQIFGNFLPTRKNAFRASESPTQRRWLRIRGTSEIPEFHYPMAALQ